MTGILASVDGLHAAAGAIRTADSILITTHVNPDGDAIGSALGLMHILRVMGKKADVAAQDGPGQRYTFLPGADDILLSVDNIYDLGIAVDCGNIDRVGNIKKALLSCGKVIRIDHHALGHAFGDIEYLDSSAAAVGEMITALTDVMEVPVPKEAGLCLLASIVEDTGAFQFDSVSARTLTICSELVAAGSDLHWVVQNLFWKHPAGAVRLCGHCLETMTLEYGGTVAWTTASLDDCRRYGAIEEDVDGVVHSLLSIAGVEVAILLRESGKDFRVSLRSRDYVDTAEIAREFGGGGHTKAAGCRLPKDPTAFQALLSAVKKRLDV